MCGMQGNNNGNNDNLTARALDQQARMEERYIRKDLTAPYACVDWESPNGSVVISFHNADGSLTPELVFNREGILEFIASLQCYPAWMK